jgi:hypothetical protein
VWPSSQYGFGLVNTGAAVVMAANPSRKLLPANVEPYVTVNEALPAIVRVWPLFQQRLLQD